MTFPRADNRSSTRWIFTLLGIEFRRCNNSWSVVEDGTSKPFRLPVRQTQEGKRGRERRRARGTTSCQATNNSSSTNGRMDYGYNITKFSFKDTKEYKPWTGMSRFLPVKVFRTSNSNKCVRICKRSKATNLAWFLECSSDSHFLWIFLVLDL